MIDSFRDEYGWASNFYFKAPFSDAFNLHFKSSEHYFASCKTTDVEWCHRIISAPRAKDAKKLGQQCPVRPDWNNIRIWVMNQALFYKFSQNVDILAKLLATGAEDLVEGNYWHDNYWGDCRCNNRTGAHPECLYKGKNNLGELLMNLRTYFRTVQRLQGV